MLALSFGIFGLIIGSFLNVFILRRGVRSLSGRSSCMACGKVIAWYDLIPVLSWLFLRGRCRHCGARISVQYPLVEASTAALFALLSPIGLAVFHTPLLIALLLIVDYLAIAALLIAIAAYDFNHTIIPDGWAYSFALLALALQFLSPMPQDLDILLLVAAGPIVALPLYLLWFISSGRWMGLGDAKLALGIGWLLGPWIGLVAVMASFILGSIILVPLLLLTHIPGLSRKGVGLTMKSEVPFGPFLIASCLLFWLLGLYGVQSPLALLGM